MRVCVSTHCTQDAQARNVSFGLLGVRLAVLSSVYLAGKQELAVRRRAHDWRNAALAGGTTGLLASALLLGRGPHVLLGAALASGLGLAEHALREALRKALRVRMMPEPAATPSEPGRSLWPRWLPFARVPDAPLSVDDERVSRARGDERDTARR